ncbi:MAG: ubiquinol-cytochrome c reductase iron-sulfur subunit [Alphaproteobacteria bacterium]|jgi:ubiquinol-cytochrome c reductase iron-sulfur subunit|nr:ubiquinol-cytochrome c reductase iron-sulfur subunit [Alphaproteobacteria bacterium]MDP6564568.1 ubiquinol-cytochrome c reductase iron-sulfur subunit [Alphaproteobacteria bacterium]MDP6811926.1 ubiquinol-cytochrome c reductase iron-sulfur subunit [Alphaproteobacteria bacterium]
MADNKGGDGHDAGRRDFLYVATSAMGAVGVGAFAWPLIDQMNPSQDVLALSSIEVDLSAVEEGQSITVSWRGKPVFIRHRTAAEIEAARQVALTDLPDPQGDEERAERPEWLVLVGVCTHLGCVPLGLQGQFKGWFCPCHGSHYDTSGRIRIGPAPTNLEVPGYVFLDDENIKIG